MLPAVVEGALHGALHADVIDGADVVGAHEDALQRLGNEGQADHAAVVLADGLGDLVPVPAASPIF